MSSLVTIIETGAQCNLPSHGKSPWLAENPEGDQVREILVFTSKSEPLGTTELRELCVGSRTAEREEEALVRTAGTLCSWASSIPALKEGNVLPISAA